MVKYHSDSDWIIKHFRGNRQITARFQELIPDGIGISIMAKAEIYAGVYRFKDWQRRSEELSVFTREFPVMPLDEAIGNIYAQERGRLKVSGSLIGDQDILIGATAIRHQVTLLTDNRRHFGRLQGLAIIPE